MEVLGKRPQVNGLVRGLGCRRHRGTRGQAAEVVDLEDESVALAAYFRDRLQTLRGGDATRGVVDPRLQEDQRSPGSNRRVQPLKVQPLIIVVNRSQFDTVSLEEIEIGGELSGPDDRTIAIPGEDRQKLGHGQQDVGAEGQTRRFEGQRIAQQCPQRLVDHGVWVTVVARAAGYFGDEGTQVEEQLGVWVARREVDADWHLVDVPEVPYGAITVARP